MEVVIVGVSSGSLNFKDIEENKEVEVKGIVQRVYFKDGDIELMANNARRFEEIKDSLTEEQLEMIEHIEHLTIREEN